MSEQDAVERAKNTLERYRRKRQKHEVFTESPFVDLYDALRDAKQALEAQRKKNERLRAQNQKLNECLETMQLDADRDSQLIREMQAALEEQEAQGG